MLQRNPPPLHHDVFSRSLWKLLIVAIPGLCLRARLLTFKVWGFKKKKKEHILVFNRTKLEILNFCELFLVEKDFTVEAWVLFPLPGL